MLVGTADVASLPAGSVAAWLGEPAALEDVEVVQAMFEVPYAVRESLLPPALHPTNPPTAVVQAWRCGTSPWGAFSLVQLRVQCRSGLRPRGFVVGSTVDSGAAASGLAKGWGFTPAVGAVHVRRFYDAVTVEAPGLALRAVEPVPLDPGDVGYSSTLNLATTPNGLRLVQLDTDVALDRVERVRVVEATLDGPAWGAPLLSLRHAVSASVGVGRVVLQPVRYCCRPDVLAFEGTETV